ncbi:arginine--tRNA ligase [Phaeodactylibacter luteus]|uniref:Arginine--tRNA ligase n=1 Tax=Phaeodactylibacter luteus TaxID=1564516 RepID=A0A5C6S3C2_9BACT|nr:arginine--tRNA ligase [Phaeodactylibacter luteus]TXB68922.1 arginine--tRNA ligase [Phaeodactylibacter luteus]
MTIIQTIQEGVAQAVKALYGIEMPAEKVTLTPTRKEFEGDYTVVVFPFTKAARKKPDQIGEELGAYLADAVQEVSGFNVIKGFLNLVVNDAYWSAFLEGIYQDKGYGRHPANGQKVMVEFSSPNTNKPLHLGHIRNILLGWSTAQILDAAGYEVVKVQVVNDRGIAICKSMLAWQEYGNGATPATTGKKGDHFVGSFYVLFEQKFQEEYKAWQQSEAGQEAFSQWKRDEKAVAKAEKAIAEAARKAEGKAEREGKTFDPADFTLEKHFFGSVFKNTYFNAHSALGQKAKAMLLAWEAGDKEVLTLWSTMNGWVYEGFDQTYAKLGVSFDKLYFESNTYLLGKDAITEGLGKGIFYQKADGSVWIDLTDAKLDHKLVLRSDGTSVYITQDIGTAQERYKDFGVDKMVYVVADEQDYHFQVLFETLKRLGEPYAAGLHHLSYGMVDLPSGKMKSREGTVVDADDLVAEVVSEARANAQERDTLSALSKAEQEEIISQVGLSALKFFIIKVQPQKRMTFDPKESVDMQGQTGPYVQNAYVRVQSVLRKAAGGVDFGGAKAYGPLANIERELIGQLYAFPALIQEAAESYDPSGIANFCYDLAKNYHRFYHDHSILNAESAAAKSFRLMLSQAVANTLRTGMNLLGIEMPERM